MRPKGWKGASGITSKEANGKWLRPELGLQQQYGRRGTGELGGAEPGHWDLVGLTGLEPGFYGQGYGSHWRGE